MIRLIPACTERLPEVVDAVLESLVDLRPWMPWATPGYSIETAVQWLHEVALKGHEFFVISPDDSYLGNVGINNIRSDDNFANLGYWIRSGAHGRGFATAAVLALLSWVRTRTDLNRLEIVAAVGNGASRRVAEKSGAVFEGVARARLLLHGRYHDAAMYSFTVDDMAG